MGMRDEHWDVGATFRSPASRSGNGLPRRLKSAGPDQNVGAGLQTRAPCRAFQCAVPQHHQQTARHHRMGVSDEHRDVGATFRSPVSRFSARCPRRLRHHLQAPRHHRMGVRDEHRDVGATFRSPASRSGDGLPRRPNSAASVSEAAHFNPRCCLQAPRNYGMGVRHNG